MKPYTHRELCLLGARYLRNKGIHGFHRNQYVVCELERVGECPDVFGFGGYSTQLIEVKVTRSDFLSDKNKLWRKHPEKGLGRYRSYLCPEGIIRPEDLPENWGLLWVNEKGKISQIVSPVYQDCNHIEELQVPVSILRREGFSPRVFDYKKYASESKPTK